MAPRRRHRPGPRATLALILGVICATAAVAAPVSIAQPTGDPYVALGDSYSSGEGLAPYLDGNAQDPAECDRSTASAYPDLVASTLGLPFTTGDFLACSGATTQDLVSSHLAAGATPTPVLGPSTKLVTLTIGGNDLNFVPTLEACVDGGFLLRLAGLLDHGCAYYEANFNGILGDLAASDSNNQPVDGVWGIPWIIRTIHALAPNATIAVGGYPRVFALTSSACWTGSVAAMLNVGGSPQIVNFPAVFSPATITTFTLLTAEFNATIAGVVAQAARTMPVVFANVAPLFTGHAISCSGAQTATSWIGSVTTALSNGQPQYNTPATSSFHPTTAGQLAYANAFLAAVGA